jgi:AraC family transcriptional regulator of adaptative response / DNA-3-methyladenine glycosylase II
MVSRALRLIDEQALDQGGVDGLAARLGIGERHLRRLFQRHLGTTPVAVAQTRRLHFAKRLLDETTLPITEVASAAGFASLRRFHSAVRATWRRPPRELRRRAHAGPSLARGALELELGFRPPLDWRGLHASLAARAVPGVERVDGAGWQRSVQIGEAHGRVTVRCAATRPALRVRIEVSRSDALAGVVERLRRCFDLGAVPAEIEAALAQDVRLAPLLRRRPGVRVVGAWDAFEAGTLALLGRGEAARGRAGRLVAALGEPLRAPTEPASPLRLFPAPERVARANLLALGVPPRRAAALHALARAALRGELAALSSRPLDEAVAALREKVGLPELAAQEVAMRGFGEPDAFPADDLELRRAWGRGGRPARAAQLARAAEAWRPWRAYAATHLWLDVAGSAGVGRARSAERASTTPSSAPSRSRSTRLRSLPQREPPAPPRAGPTR